MHTDITTLLRNLDYRSLLLGLLLKFSRCVCLLLIVL